MQVQGSALRVAAPSAAVAGLLSRAGIHATVEAVPANLEEAFVAIAGQPEPEMSRTGRRPGTPDTRDAILAIARRRFAIRGYDAASLRDIAAEAKVDPALIIHYFATKQGLFGAAARACPTGYPAYSKTSRSFRSTTSPRPWSAPTWNSSTATEAATPSSPWSAPRSPTTTPPPCCASS